MERRVSRAHSFVTLIVPIINLNLFKSMRKSTYLFSMLAVALLSVCTATARTSEDTARPPCSSAPTRPRRCSTCAAWVIPPPKARLTRPSPPPSPRHAPMKIPKRTTWTLSKLPKRLTRVPPRVSRCLRPASTTTSS